MQSVEKELRGVDGAESIPPLTMGVWLTVLKYDTGAVHALKDKYKKRKEKEGKQRKRQRHRKKRGSRRSRDSKGSSSESDSCSSGSSSSLSDSTARGRKTGSLATQQKGVSMEGRGVAAWIRVR